SRSAPRRAAMNKARTGWKSYYYAKDSRSTEARPISVWGVRPWRWRKRAPLLAENSPKTPGKLRFVDGFRTRSISERKAMTNTLHRYGNERNLSNDFIVFAIPCRGYNDKDSVPKLKRFLRTATKYNPVNLGDAYHGGAYRPSKNLNPTAHGPRRSDGVFKMEIEGKNTPTTVAAFSDNTRAWEEFVTELQKEALGFSINISALIARAQECCDGVGITRHSVEYSLGF